jgi:hypothetical protein
LPGNSSQGVPEVLILLMAIGKVRPGQVWSLEGTGESWLVTKVYSQAFSSYALLRKIGGGDNDLRRLKITRSAGGVTLPGYRLSQETDQI